MRHFVGVLLLVCVCSANADTFRCIEPSGLVVFSDTPCDNGKKFSKIRPSESVQDTDAARRQIEQQKAYAERAAAENEAARRSTAGASSLPDQSSPPPGSPSEISFPSSGSGSGGTDTGATAGIPRGIPSAPSRR